MTNKIKRSLEQGDSVFGARVRSFSSTVVQVVGQLGLEYAYLDLEHAGFSPYDTPALEQRILASNKADVELVVRLPGAKPAMIRSVLDAGVRTIILPRVKTASEVEHAIRAARFEYNGEAGERGFGTAPANDWGVRPPDYTKTEDETVLVGVMLETEAAVDNASEITAVPELGFAKIGVGDLSVSLGCPQDYEHQLVQNAIGTLEKQCRENNVPLGRGVSDVKAAKEAINNGYQLVDIGGDLDAIRATFQERLDQLRLNRNS